MQTFYNTYLHNKWFLQTCFKYKKNLRCKMSVMAPSFQRVFQVSWTKGDFLQYNEFAATFLHS